ncbi:MAG: type I glyceraldehyde-3-phosphate dehydrogenase [Bacillota bacterium]|nr:type I glyceraldehyde-3-phosphate dehydrogenase [Bacillota bacterium]
MKKKVAINGFGRIGRCAFRSFLEKNSEKIDIVAINGIKNPEEGLFNFIHDSIYGKFEGNIKVDDDFYVYKDHRVKITNERDLTKLPWDELGVDIVIESTGKFTDKKSASTHIESGAKKVIISAPSKDADLTVVMGVNQDKYNPKEHNIISNASCTTNCLAPLAKVLLDEYGVFTGEMTTIHSYTSNQNLLDAVNKKDLRRSRAAAMSLIPTTTGAAKAIKEVIPELDGKIDGMSVRVPTSAVSLVDLVVNLNKEVTKEEINNLLKEKAEGELKGILGFSDEPLVSVDYIKDSRSSIIDGLSTDAIEKTVKIISWYDNEWGYSNRLVQLTEYVASK